MRGRLKEGDYPCIDKANAGPAPAKAPKVPADRLLSFAATSCLLVLCVHESQHLCGLSYFCPAGPQLVLVFMVGGTTYEEARAVADLNAQVLLPLTAFLPPGLERRSQACSPLSFSYLQGERGEGWAAGTRFLLGGTGVLNSRAFLRDLLEVGANERIAGA